MTTGPQRRLAAWYFFYFAFIGAFSPYFTLYLQSLSLSAWAIGVLMSLMQVMRLVAPGLWSWLAERLGRRLAVIRASALLSALGFLLFFVSRDFWALFAGMGLMAFFWSAALPQMEALTLDHLGGTAERYGRIRLWGSIGFIVAVLGVGAWLDVAPLSSLLVVCLALLLGVAAVAWRLPEPAAGLPRRPPPAGAPGVPHMLALLAACFLMSAAHGPLYVFYSIHLVAHGYGKTAVGAFWAIGVLAEIAVFALMPRLMRAWGLRAILVASFALAVVRFLLIGWCADQAALLLVAQLMHGATFGAFHAGAVAAINRWYPAGRQARAQAIYGSVSFGAGGMAGGLMSGQAWDSLGPGWTYSLGAACAAVGLLLAWRGLSAGASADRRPVP